MKHFTRSTIVTGILMLLCVLLCQCSKDNSQAPFVQSELLYEKTALKPYISNEALSLHYDAHFAAYVKKANMLLKESPFKNKPIEKIITLSHEDQRYTSLYQNTSQAWNHDFFFKCLKPEGGGSPGGKLLEQIKSSFGSIKAFKAEFTEKATGIFGSGWVFLVSEGEKLEILVTKDGDTPFIKGKYPLFCVDVWEHAYYVDYHYNRKTYISNILNHLANWDFAEKRIMEK